MNHPLAVYTVIYVAILFVTVSIWGGKIGEATGDYRVLLLAQAIFALKLAIDDYVHFQGARNKLHFDLHLSLLIYLLLAISIATAATGRGSASAVAFAVVFVTGALWILNSGFEGEGRLRRIGWFVVNVLSAALLLVVAFARPPQSATYTDSSILLMGLVALIVFDFFYFGTLRRLAELHSQGGGVLADTNGHADSTPVLVTATPVAVTVPIASEEKEATVAMPRTAKA
jgi:hypothetical protein